MSVGVEKTDAVQNKVTLLAGIASSRHRPMLRLDDLQFPVVCGAMKFVRSWATTCYAELLPLPGFPGLSLDFRSVAQAFQNFPFPFPSFPLLSVSRKPQFAEAKYLCPCPPRS